MSKHAKDKPRLSLVVATLGRKTELHRLLSSLMEQTERDFEVLIMDQNPPGFLDDLIAPYRDWLKIHQIATPRNGASAARNRGAALAAGEWLMFPDDDCWYPADMVNRLFSHIGEDDHNLVCGRPMEGMGTPAFQTSRPDRVAITEALVWTTAIEWLSAVRRELFLVAGGFDERVGPGAGTPFAAHAIHDLVLGVLRAGGRGLYDPDWNGFHEFHPEALGEDASILRMHGYAHGMGYVFHKRRLGPIQAFRILHRPLIGSILFRLKGDKNNERLARTILSGIVKGYLLARALPPLPPRQAIVLSPADNAL